MWRATLFFACGALVGGCLRGMNQGSVTAAGRESAAGLQPTRRRLPVAAGRQLAGRAGGAQRAADGRDSQPRCHRRARRRGRQRRRGRVGGRQRPPAPRGSRSAPAARAPGPPQHWPPHQQHRPLRQRRRLPQRLLCLRPRPLQQCRRKGLCLAALSSSYFTKGACRHCFDTVAAVQGRSGGGYGV